MAAKSRKRTGWATLVGRLLRQAILACLTGAVVLTAFPIGWLRWRPQDSRRELYALNHARARIHWS